MQIGRHRVRALYVRFRLKLALDMFCFYALVIVHGDAAKPKAE